MFEKLGKALDSMVESVSTGLQLTEIDPHSQAIAIPYPESDPVKVRLEMGAGRLNLKAGGSNLIEGTATYNVQEWSPETIVEGNTVTLRQGHAWNVFGFWGNYRNEWDLALGTPRPYALHVGKGVGEGTMDLGGVPFTEAMLETGAGKSTILFSKGNPQKASHFTVRCGAGETRISDLLNTNADVIMVESGTGEIRLDFSGEALTRDVLVKVAVGTGHVAINVSPGIAVRASVNKGLGDVRARGNFMSMDGRVFQTNGFSSAAGPKITFEVNAGVGSVEFNTNGA